MANIMKVKCSKCCSVFIVNENNMKKRFELDDKITFLCPKCDNDSFTNDFSSYEENNKNVEDMD